MLISSALRLEPLLQGRPYGPLSDIDVDGG